MAIYVTGNLARELADEAPVELTTWPTMARPTAVRRGHVGSTLATVALDGSIHLSGRDLARLLLAVAGDERAVELLIEEMEPEEASPAYGF